MVVALKSLPDNFSIWFISALVLFDHVFIQEDFLGLGMKDDFLDI